MGQKDVQTDKPKPSQQAAPEPQIPYYGAPQEPGSGSQ